MSDDWIQAKLLIDINPARASWLLSRQADAAGWAYRQIPQDPKRPVLTAYLNPGYGDGDNL